MKYQIDIPPVQETGECSKECPFRTTKTIMSSDTLRSNDYYEVEYAACALNFEKCLLSDIDSICPSKKCPVYEDHFCVVIYADLNSWRATHDGLVTQGTGGLKEVIETLGTEKSILVKTSGGGPTTTKYIRKTL